MRTVWVLSLNLVASCPLVQRSEADPGKETFCNLSLHLPQSGDVLRSLAGRQQESVERPVHIYSRLDRLASRLSCPCMNLLCPCPPLSQSFGRSCCKSKLCWILCSLTLFSDHWEATEPSFVADLRSQFCVNWLNSGSTLCDFTVSQSWPFLNFFRYLPDASHFLLSHLWRYLDL